MPVLTHTYSLRPSNNPSCFKFVLQMRPITTLLTSVPLSLSLSLSLLFVFLFSVCFYCRPIKFCEGCLWFVYPCICLCLKHVFSHFMAFDSNVIVVVVVVVVVVVFVCLFVSCYYTVKRFGPMQVGKALWKCYV